MTDNIQLGVEHQEADIKRIFVSHRYITIPALSAGYTGMRPGLATGRASLTGAIAGQSNSPRQFTPAPKSGIISAGV